MSKKQGNLVMTVAPLGDRSATPSTNTEIQRGNINAILIGCTSPPRFAGQLWVEFSVVRLGLNPPIAFHHLIGSYITLNHIPSFFGFYPIRFGDGIQLMVMSDTAGLTIYANVRFEQEEITNEPK